MPNTTVVQTTTVIQITTTVQTTTVVSTPSVIQTPSFVNVAASKIMFGKDSSAFMRLYQKMDSFQQKLRKQITIAHIGGSHVQGGTWSNTFLSGMQEELKPVGGGYFIFPYKYAKTNSPPFCTSFTDGKWKKCRCVGKDYCLPLGMCGMSVNTNDSANYFGIALTKKSLIKGFNTVKVYHNFNASFDFSVCPTHSMQIVRIDKKELGYTQFDLELPIDSLSFCLLKKDTLQKDFILYGFYAESNLTNGIGLAALGANGAQSSSFLRCTYFTEQLRSIAPDLVILSLGVNDTQSKGFEKDNYIEHYDSLIAKVREANPDVAILLTTTTDNFIRRRTPNKRPIEAREAMLELMQKHGIGVWDLYTIMGGFKAMVKWNKVGLASKDRVHFSPKGYVIVGTMMSNALITSYRNSIKK
jgi:lysophospholipase L1-like esterase